MRSLRLTRCEVRYVREHESKHTVCNVYIGLTHLSVAFLIALLMLSTGTLFFFAAEITSLRDLFASGDADPPSLTAMMIFLPN